MKVDNLRLKNVKKDYLEILLSNLNDVEKFFNNADFITPTEIQIIMIQTVNYSKNTLWITEIETFNKDLLFSCIYKDIKLLDDKIDSIKLNNILNIIITKVWDENSNFSKIWMDVENIIKYFEYLKYSNIQKDEALTFLESLKLKDEDDFNDNNQNLLNENNVNDFDKWLDSIFKMFDNLFWNK